MGIRISKEHILMTTFSEEHNKVVHYIVEDEGIFAYWSETFDGFDEDVTFLDFVKHCTKNPHVKEMINKLCNLHAFDAWLETLTQQTEIDDEPLDCLEIGVVLDALRGEDETAYFVDRWVNMSGRKADSDDRWSLSWLTWGDIAHLPMKWQPKTTMSMTTIRKLKRWPWERFRSKSRFKRKIKHKSYETESQVTLGELIAGVFHEVTWGTPEEEKALRERVLKAKEEMDNGEGTYYELDLDAWCDGFPMEECQKEVKRKKKKEV